MELRAPDDHPVAQRRSLSLIRRPPSERSRERRSSLDERGSSKGWRVQNNAASQSVLGIVPAFTDTGTSPYYPLGAHFFGRVRRIFMPPSIADAAR